MNYEVFHGHYASILTPSGEIIDEPENSRGLSEIASEHEVPEDCIEIHFGWLVRKIGHQRWEATNEIREQILKRYHGLEI